MQLAHTSIPGRRAVDARGPARDLARLRSWGRSLAQAPAHLQSHIEEQLWEAILAEEAGQAGRARRRNHRRWFQGLLRPAVAAGAAAMLAVGVAVTSSRGPETATSARGGTVVQASSGLL